MSAERLLDGLMVIREAFPKTVRLVSSARLRPPVLEALVPAEDIAALAEIEGATSARLLAEQRGNAGFGREEFLHGVPYAAFVNAAFAYSKPSEPNRFNASRGAWYAALEVQTSMREVAFHMADFLQKSGRYKGVVEYAELYASMAGEFVDLRAMGSHPCLNPRAGDRLSDRQRHRRRGDSERTERNRLPVGAACRGHMLGGVAAARGAVGRPGRSLPV